MEIINLLKKNLFIVKLTFLILILSLTTNSYGQSRVVWSYDAMAAVPSIPAIKNDLYRVLWGRVIFNEGKTGIVTLFCPITEGTGKFRSLILTYKDGDGPLGSSEVSAVLRRVNRTGGPPVSFQYGLVSSNGVGYPVSNESQGNWKTKQSARTGETLRNQSHQLDFKNYYYYVQITMKRTDPEVPLGVMGVYLTN